MDGPGRRTCSSPRPPTAISVSSPKTCGALGIVVADLHAALGSTSSRSTCDDAQRWHDSAFATLAEASSASWRAGQRDASHRARRRRRTHPEWIVGLVDEPVLDAHGDLHVGHVLRTGDQLVITDFDGNPGSAPACRTCPAGTGSCRPCRHPAVAVPRGHRRRQTPPISVRTHLRPGRQGVADGVARRLPRPADPPVGRRPARRCTPSAPSDCNRCCAKSSTRAVTCRAGCTSRTRPCPHYFNETSR